LSTTAENKVCLKCTDALVSSIHTRNTPATQTALIDAIVTQTWTHSTARVPGATARRPCDELGTATNIWELTAGGNTPLKDEAWKMLTLKI